MTPLRWTLRRWRCSHGRFFGQLLVILMSVTSTVTSSSLTKRQYDALHLLHRDYLHNGGGAESGAPIMKTLDTQSAAESDAVFLKRETSGVNLLKSSKDALIVTKKSYLKKDWCKTEPLIQRIKEPGCVTRTIVNRFCYGQCNSFYIPKDSGKVGGEAFKSCAFCKPKRFRWITITLNCPALTPPFRRKRIQRVKKCKCISEIMQS